MKKNDISRLHSLRSINLRIGYAVAIFMAILAFNWTSERPPLPDFESEFPLDEAEVNVVRTKQPDPASKPPPTTFNVADKILEVPEVSFSTTLAVMPVDSAFHENPVPAKNDLPLTPAKTTPLPRPEEPADEGFLILAEEMPRFPGCEKAGMTKSEKQVCATGLLLQFLGQNLRYPAIARQNGIEGTVVVRFIVEKDGSISDAKVIRDIGGGCGAEALQVVESMPAWLPGKQRGRPVRVQFNLPVKFKLN